MQTVITIRMESRNGKDPNIEFPSQYARELPNHIDRNTNSLMRHPVLFRKTFGFRSILKLKQNHLQVCLARSGTCTNFYSKVGILSA